MSAHDHREFVEGCYRCDLSRDEVSEDAPTTEEVADYEERIRDMARMHAVVLKVRAGVVAEEPEEVMTGEIRAVEFDDGKPRDPDECGLEGCECPDHDYPPRRAGTYITVRLDGGFDGGWVMACRDPSGARQRERRDTVSDWPAPDYWCTICDRGAEACTHTPADATDWMHDPSNPWGLAAVDQGDEKP